MSAFLEARDFLLAKREDYAGAYAGFQWPKLDEFNWALDFFDAQARGNERPALWIVNESGAEEKLSFEAMRKRSNQVANFLRGQGLKRGDRLLIMLPNVVPLWEITLAVLKLGAVLSPATVLLTKAELADRIERGDISCVVTDAAGVAKCQDLPVQCRRIVVGQAPGWVSFTEAYACGDAFASDVRTKASDPFLLYFTSGTTAKPKMVLHTQSSYPVGHLSTMYWIGLKPGDVHWNISSPGWAKHAWSCFFAPWNAGATIFIYEQSRFDARRSLDTAVRCGVTSLCAPPTAWRAFVLQDLKSFKAGFRELVSAGEPLNPEVIEKVRAAWGITIRDGYGQTETTCIVGNSPGQPVKPGSMGRPMPGYRVTLRDIERKESKEGEVCVELEPRPVGLMESYLGDTERTRAALGGSFYGTSDVATRDADGYLTFVGRTDDVFKSSDYRISPFELESVLIEHAAVAEAAVVPSPDPRRLAVPKAFVVLKPGHEPSADTAASILRFVEERVAPYKRIRCVEFAELPKTISGKIRRVELRALEAKRRAANEVASTEFWARQERSA
ncbi:MAG TPA: AMP-binding protein [Burkholderiales bacterium]|nr:AMP-binding protein [Burkholderiales bacterium]